MSCAVCLQSIQQSHLRSGESRKNMGPEQVVARHPVWPSARQPQSLITMCFACQNARRSLPWWQHLAAERPTHVLSCYTSAGLCNVRYKHRHLTPKAAAKMRVASSLGNVSMVKDPDGSPATSSELYCNILLQGHEALHAAPGLEIDVVPRTEIPSVLEALLVP